jgi:hypothetical protein
MIQLSKLFKCKKITVRNNTKQGNMQINSYDKYILAITRISTIHTCIATYYKCTVIRMLSFFNVNLYEASANYIFLRLKLYVLILTVKLIHLLLIRKYAYEDSIYQLFSKCRYT